MGLYRGMGLFGAGIDGVRMRDRRVFTWFVLKVVNLKIIQLSENGNNNKKR